VTLSEEIDHFARIIENNLAKLVIRNNFLAFIKIDSLILKATSLLNYKLQNDWEVFKRAAKRQLPFVSSRVRGVLLE